MGRPNPNKSSPAKKNPKQTQGRGCPKTTQGGCPQHTKAIGCTLKKHSLDGVLMMTNEYASIIYNGGKLNERTINIGLHRIV